MNIHQLRTRYRDAILALAAEHKLENVRVFGSVVRGEAGENSDIDLLVHAQKGCSLLDISGFQVEASEVLGGRKVDVVDDASIKPRIAPFILSQAVPL